MFVDQLDELIHLGLLFGPFGWLIEWEVVAVILVS